MQNVTKRPSRIWWVYFVYCAAMWVLGVATLLQHNSSFPRIAYVTSLVDTIGLVGLFLFIRNVPLLAAGFWRFAFLLLIMKATFGIGSVLHDLVSYPQDHMLLIILLAGISGLPVIYAVGRYAFGSPHLWSKVESAGA